MDRSPRRDRSLASSAGTGCYPRRSTPRVMVEVLRSADLVDRAQRLLERLRSVVEERGLVRRLSVIVPYILDARDGLLSGELVRRVPGSGALPVRPGRRETPACRSSSERHSAAAERSWRSRCQRTSTPAATCGTAIVVPSDHGPVRLARQRVHTRPVITLFGRFASPVSGLARQAGRRSIRSTPS